MPCGYCVGGVLSRLTAGKMFPKTGNIFLPGHAHAPSPEGLTKRARPR
jgi:hypothetical protein